jgi:hypothetical protein
MIPLRQTAIITDCRAEHRRLTGQFAAIGITRRAKNYTKPGSMGQQDGAMVAGINSLPRACFVVKCRATPRLRDKLPSIPSNSGELIAPPPVSSGHGSLKDNCGVADHFVKAESLCTQISQTYSRKRGKPSWTQRPSVLPGWGRAASFTVAIVPTNRYWDFLRDRSSAARRRCPKVKSRYGRRRRPGCGTAIELWTTKGFDSARTDRSSLP